MSRANKGTPPYFVLLGMVIGMLVAGLAIPWAAGTPGAERAGTGYVPLTGSDDSGTTGSPNDSPSGSFGRPAPGGADGPVEGPDGEPGRSGTDPASPSNPRSGFGGAGTPGGGNVGTDPNAPPPGGGAPPPGAPSGLGASDRGVTADKIRVGMMILDLGGLSAVGISVPGTDPEQQRQSWESWVAEINEGGGIGGRLLDPYYRKYDLLDQDDQRAACLDMADQKVFTVFDAGGMNDPAVLCVTQEHETPMIALGGQGFADVMYRRSEGRLFSTFAAGSRSTANFAYELHRRGILDGRKIGVLSQDGPGVKETLDRGLFDTLEATGHEVTHHYALSSDSGTSSSQIPVAVQEMRTRQVDLVLLLTTVLPATQFVQNAEKQAWFPTYWMGDWGGAYSDVYVRNMSSSFDGHLITTVRTGEWRQNRPEPAAAAECRQIYEARTGKGLDVSTAEYAFTLRGCTMMRIFVAGAAAAGADLTRARLSGAIQQLGPVPLATFGGGGFRPGKFDAADQVRRADFDPACTCWMPADEFVPGWHR